MDRPYMTPEELRKVKSKLDCTSDEQLGELIGRSREQVNYYLNGHTEIPFAVARLLRIYCSHPNLKKSIQELA